MKQKVEGVERETQIKSGLQKLINVEECTLITLAKPVIVLSGALRAALQVLDDGNLNPRLKKRCLETSNSPRAFPPDRKRVR